MATSSGILQSFLLHELNDKNKDALRYEKLLKYNKGRRGTDFIAPLEFYLGELNDVDKALFPYLSEEKKNQLLYDLQVTYLLLHTEPHIESRRQKIENKKKYALQAKRCEELIRALDPEYQDFVAQDPVQECFTDGKPVKYLGIPLAKELSEQIVDWMDRKTKTIKEYMGALNEKRLYWVWGSVLLKTVLGSLPEDFFNTTQASGAIRKPDPYTGCLSWTLYYFRFALNLSLLLKHTIKGPWMSEEEAKTPWTERFQTQWSQRKFTLLNDSLWGTANLVCFFWLNGKGALGTWGDALTILLLVFDISVAVWDFEEQKTQYNKDMLQFNLDIAEVERSINAQMLLVEAAKREFAELKLELSDQESNEKSDAELARKYAIYQEYLQVQLKMQMQLNTLKRAKKKCATNWEYQKISLITNIAYAVGLMLAFVILTAPFMPLAAGVAAALGIAGAVLCFAFTIINSAIKGGMELRRTRQSIKEIKAECDEKIEMFKNNPDLSENEKKFLFLEIKKLQMDTEYQKQIVVLQTAQLVRNIMLEALIPALIFATLVFLPLGVGLGALGGALGLAIASHFLINIFFKPGEKKELPPFKELEDEYHEFCDTIDHENEIEESKGFTHGAYSFFNPLKSDSDDSLDSYDSYLPDPKSTN